MADVFLSYAAEDRERAREFANALSARGWSVWWDRKIRAGETFDEVIERELDAAKNIVVLWSAASVGSEWVRNEAAVGAQRRILIPVLLDEVKVPLEFRRRQTIDLVAWNGDPEHAGAQALFEALGGAPPELATAPASRPTARPAVRLVPGVVAAATAFVVGCLLTYLAVSRWASSDTPTAPSEAAAPKPHGTKPSLPVNLATSGNGIYLDVVGFRRTGELTTLEWVLRNTSDQRISVCSSAFDTRLIDQVSGQSWRAMHSGGPAAGCQYIDPRGQSGAWAKFKLPAQENMRLALSLRILTTTPDLPSPEATSN